MTRAWLLVVAGCARFDLGEPIQLVPDPSWSASDVATLDAAGTCWNLRFGTQFETVFAPSLPQVVDVAYNAFACWGGDGGNFQPGEPAGVAICPLDDWPDVGIPVDRRLFTALVHELGHASGIRTEGHGVDSVMGANEVAVFGGGHVLFSSEDVQLLRDAAPDFTFVPVCDDVRVEGEACVCP